MFRPLIFTVALCSPLLAYGKIDLVTLPIRDQVQLTIYNPADLTFVKEQRTLTLKKGLNRLEFSWENTLIDPTSVQLEAPQHRAQVTLLEVAYPPNTKGSAVWSIQSEVEGEIPVEITFFTSGIHWQSSYMGTLSSDEQQLQLTHDVRVDNQSGEDYGNAQTRLVLGQVQLLDEIAALARRQYPYGSPYPVARPMSTQVMRGAMVKEESEALSDIAWAAAPAAMELKAIFKEQLSEYVLYSIEGTENIVNTWAKRLQAFDVKEIPVKALYRYDERRYGYQVQRLLSFVNDDEHQLGQNPLPEGAVTLFRQNADQSLSFVAQTDTRYIPIEQKAEFDLGAAREVSIEPKLMGYQTANYMFDYKGNISGYDEVEQWQIKLQNARDLPVSVELVRYADHGYWQIQQDLPADVNYEKLDMSRFQYQLTLAPHSEVTLDYSLTLNQGQRQQKR